MKKYICLIFSITILACARDANKVKSEAAEYDAAESDYEFMIEVGDEDAKDIVVEDMEIEEEMNLNEDTNNGYFKNKDDLGSSTLSNPLTQLTEQKLKEYFDLIQLKQEHPEFKADIILQLQKFSNDTTIGKNYSKGFKLEHIRIVEYLETDSDTTQKLKLFFDVIHENSKRTDSIIATIFQKTIMVDNEDITSNKITFSKVSN